MNKYKIILKRPHLATIWSGPGSSNSVLTYPEDDKDKTRREAVATRLEALGAEEVIFNKRAYCYFAEMTAEQAKEVETWPGTKKILEILG